MVFGGRGIDAHPARRIDRRSRFTLHFLRLHLRRREPLGICLEAFVASIRAEEIHHAPVQRLGGRVGFLDLHAANGIDRTALPDSEPFAVPVQPIQDCERGQEDCARDHSHPMQDREAAADHIARQLHCRKHMEYYRRQHKRKKDNAAHPDDQGQQHQRAQECHTGTGVLCRISRITVSAWSDFFSVEE